MKHYFIAKADNPNKRRYTIDFVKKMGYPIEAYQYINATHRKGNK